MAFLLIPRQAISGTLVILSGQSNMALLDPNEVFIPTVQGKYDDLIFVHDADGGQPISEWDDGKRMWLSLTSKIDLSTSGKDVNALVFIWMQGETDAWMELSNSYEASVDDLFLRVHGLFPDANVSYVVGRITDWHLTNTDYPSTDDWIAIREIQERIGQRSNCFMVNTDDLNSPDDLPHFHGHYDALALRFADALFRLNPKRLSTLQLILDSILTKTRDN